jgi:hypothetical protein
LQYDWLHLASNYYVPLSGWKGSYDFDSRFIEERPAEGWDARVKAWLPFYRNVALTGAYTQWYGDHVGMFGRRNLEKDPKVWSWEVEYTPVPLVSGFITQRSTERGRTDTEFGLNFTYHFGMPFEDQIKHSKVAELRGVSGSRHEFVDRENRIILEYRAKDSHRIEYLGPAGPNVFRFRVLNGFDEFMAGQTVYVTANGMYLAEAAPEQPATLFAQVMNFLDELISVRAAYAGDRSKSYVTDSRGEFLVELDGYSLPSGGEVTVTVRTGKSEQTFTLNGSELGPISITITSFANGGDFTGGNLYSTASLTAGVVNVNGSPVNGATVTWSVVSALNNSQAMMPGWGGKKAGLTWGNAPEPGLNATTLPQERIVSATNNTGTTDSNGETTMLLTDIVGERVITVKAEATIGATTHSVTQDVSFGNGPLSEFKAPDEYLTIESLPSFEDAYNLCNGANRFNTDGVNPNSWTQGSYVGGGKMPTSAQMLAVSIPSADNSVGQGAAYAAGWDPGSRRWWWWTGEASAVYYAFLVALHAGFSNSTIGFVAGYGYGQISAVACLQ